MNTKIIIAATVAAMSLATTAFAAGEGRGGPTPAAQTTYYAAGLNNATLPEDGQNGAVESPNSVPKGAMVGTEAYRYAQSVDRYFAQQADHRFAQTHRLLPNG